MRKVLLLIFLTTLAVGCDLLPEKDRRVVLNGTFLDAQTRQPLANIQWRVITVGGVGSLEVHDYGVTTSDEMFQARYARPYGLNPYLQVNRALEQDYISTNQQIFGTRSTISLTVLLEKREPQ